MNEFLLTDLIAKTRAEVHLFGQSRSTQYQFDLAWRWLSDYFVLHGQTIFSEQLANQYVKECKKKLVLGFMKIWRYKLIRRSTQFLKDYLNQGNVTWKHYSFHRMQLTKTTFINLRENFLTKLKEEQKGNGTIQFQETLTLQFLKYLEQNGHIDVGSVDLTTISQFIPFIAKQYQPTSMRTVLSALRVFLRFMEEKDLTSIPLHNAAVLSFGRKTLIIPTLTYEEEKKLFIGLNRDTGADKRNLAMILLALRLGLRSIDIIHLKLDDIHWKQNTLNIIQEKTKTSLILPLLPDVGNAIADYILNKRPVSIEPYIFLRSTAPYRKMLGRSSCYGVSVKLMRKAGIRQKKGDRKGFHCLRHSAAARLLEAGTPLPVISSVMGHRDKDSTKIYLSTDLEHLRSCALGLDGLEVTRQELL